METLITIIFGSAYLAVLLYVFLLEYDSFREYLVMLDNIIGFSKRFKNVHLYSIIVAFSSVLFCLSTIGLIIMLALIADYISFIIKNKEVLKNE